MIILAISNEEWAGLRKTLGELEKLYYGDLGPHPDASRQAYDEWEEQIEELEAEIVSMWDSVRVVGELNPRHLRGIEDEL